FAIAHPAVGDRLAFAILDFSEEVHRRLIGAHFGDLVHRLAFLHGAGELSARDLGLALGFHAGLLLRHGILLRGNVLRLHAGAFFLGGGRLRGAGRSGGAILAAGGGFAGEAAVVLVGNAAGIFLASLRVTLVDSARSGFFGGRRFAADLFIGRFRLRRALRRALFLRRRGLVLRDGG